MPTTLSTIMQSFLLLWSRKSRWPLVLGPVILGVVFYSSFFYLGFDFISQKLQPWLINFFHIDQMGFLIRWLLIALMTLIGFFLMNWTFVLVVSLLAAPFNDFLSESIAYEIESQTFHHVRHFWNEIFSFLWNEIKKVSVIIFFSFIAFFMGFAPVLIPFSLWMSFILIAAQFADYSWSREKLTAKECMMDIRKNFFQYSFSGAVFFFLISVPIVNLFVPAWATSHFTLLFKKNINTKNLISKNI